MDAVGRVPHRSPMRGVASDVVACTLVPRLSFFFSHIRVDSARFAPTWLLFALSRADLARIKPYWLDRVVSADD